MSTKSKKINRELKKLEEKKEEVNFLQNELKNTNEAIEKEKEEKERSKIEDVGTDKDINYIISHNQVLTVPKITKKMIEDGGKFCEGIDAYTGKKIHVLDKDYGKSSELMRALLEGKEEKSKKWIWLSLGIGFFLLIIGVAVAMGIEEKKVNKVEKNEVIISNKILPSSNTEKEDEYIKNINKTEILEKRENIEENEVIVVKNNIGDFRNEFELEKLQIEYSHLIAENNNLIIDYRELEEKNEILQEKLFIYESKQTDLTQEAFLLHLGTLIYNKCEKAVNTEVKDNCKNLYYKYVNND